jgi:hypothetical protein
MLELILTCMQDGLSFQGHEPAMNVSGYKLEEKDEL